MNVGYAFLLSALKGLSTTIGSVLGILVKKPGPRFMALSLGASFAPKPICFDPEKIVNLAAPAIIIIMR
ncbi:MAG: hypothetical protein U9R38_01200 [Candidatus Margulisiibacteriota bacterium]|nr:hypothetical protein [Candidatus Margulisiibacteriota bacterium]